GSTVGFFIAPGEVQLGETGRVSPLNNLNIAGPSRLYGDVEVLGQFNSNGQLGLANDVTITANELLFENSIVNEDKIVRGMTVNAASRLEIQAVVGFGGMPINHFRSISSAPIFLTSGIGITTREDQLYGGPVSLGDDFELTGSAMTLGDSVELNTHSLTINTSLQGGAATGPISGTGAFIKQGAGGFALTGDNTFTGGLFVDEGNLQLIGSTVAASPVSVSNAALQGTGIAGGAVALTASVLAPGISPGQLDTGDLIFDSGSALAIEVDGLIPGTEHDQVFVTGSVTLDGAALTVSGSYVPNGQGAEIILIENDGNDPVLDLFIGQPEGAMVQTGNGVLAISYVGGDGNDVVLMDTEAIFADNFETLN
ncbi:MAG: autotransporter-associated beta strand repeat-containing protein, partial [Pseudomonadota bacterium]